MAIRNRLGVIRASIFLLILLLNPSNYVFNATIRLVSTTKGTIEAGNYTHYYLNENGNFKIVLISHLGDCDLYVSDKYRMVTFDNYEWQSITYGEDEIYISEDMKRPLSIAVYAHPYYVKSTYTLNQYKIQLDQTENNDFGEFSYTDFLNRDLSASDINKNTDFKTENFHSQHDMYAQHSQFSQAETSNHAQKLKEDFHRDGDEDAEEDDGGSRSFFWNLFIHLLEIIAEVFL